MTGTEHPASLDSGLFPVPLAQGKRAEITTSGQIPGRGALLGDRQAEGPRSTLHPEGGRTGCVLGEYPPRGRGDARPRHLPTYQKQLPGSQEQAIPAHRLSVCAHRPSRDGLPKSTSEIRLLLLLPYLPFFNISCVLLLTVRERHKYRLVLVLNTSSCLLSQPCRQRYPSS